jgi:lysophospholipase L1-like esterase
MGHYNPQNLQDVLDVNNKTVPSSLRADYIHLNERGYELVAKSVLEYITNKGW